MKDVLKVRLIKDLPQGRGLDIGQVRIGDVVTLSREQAHILIAEGHAVPCAHEPLRPTASGAGSEFVITVCFSPLTPDGWDLVTDTQLNALLIGPRHVTYPLLRSLRPHLAHPVIRAVPHLPLALPPADQVGTIIVEDVGRLDVVGQMYLLEWMGAVPSARVISTSPIPLLPMVTAGTFDAALYYRLNLLYVRC
jgi:hypothetical protein